MTKLSPSDASNDKSSPPFNGQSGIIKKGRKSLVQQKLQFSPGVKLPNTNKVFVVGAKMGLILIRTQRQRDEDDAFTHTANVVIEDPESGASNRLNIIKICSRRQSQVIDKAIMQATAYPSQWYVTLVEEEKNTAEYRREHAEEFIKFLNDTKWKYPQTFSFIADETKMEGEVITGTWDMYLLNGDIAGVLKQYLYDDMGSFMEDTIAVANVFGPRCTEKQAGGYLKDYW